MIRIGTDCSGIEAPIQAFKRLNIPFHHVFSSDIDKHVKKVVTELYKPDVFYDDLMARDNSKAPKVDLYIAGFPCQAFSMAGQRKGFDDVRGSVFFGVADYIRQAQPEVFILENVKGLLSHEKGRTFQTIIDLLSNNGGTVNSQLSLDMFEDGLGYHIHHAVLNTKHHAVPQNRERVFIIGFKNPRKFRFPIPEPINTRLLDVLEAEVDVKYFLSDKMIKGFLIHADRHAKRGNGFGFKPNDLNREARSINAKEGTRHCDNYIKVKSATSKGYEEAKEGDSINFSVPNSETRRGRVGKKVAQTLDTACNQATIHDNKIRRLTPLECFRLQDFPDEFHAEVEAIGISDTQRYKMAGNSMTVRVVEKILRNIYE